LEFLILTAARTSEVLEVEWREVDFENRIWVIPAQRMKARREHRVPLSARAVEILNRQKSSARAGTAFVFTGYGGETPLSKKSLYRMAMGASVTA
jgi:integrase